MRPRASAALIPVVLLAASPALAHHAGSVGAPLASVPWSGVDAGLREGPPVVGALVGAGGPAGGIDARAFLLLPLPQHLVLDASAGGGTLFHEGTPGIHGRLGLTAHFPVGAVRPFVALTTSGATARTLLGAAPGVRTALGAGLVLGTARWWLSARAAAAAAWIAPGRGSTGASPGEPLDAVLASSGGAAALEQEIAFGFAPASLPLLEAFISLAADETIEGAGRGAVALTASALVSFRVTGGFRLLAGTNVRWSVEGANAAIGATGLAGVAVTLPRAARTSAPLPVPAAAASAPPPCGCPHEVGAVPVHSAPL